MKIKLICYLMILADFYLLPLLIRDTGSAMMMLLILMPAICFSISLFYGMKSGFSLLYPLIAALLFLPAVWIFYNSTAWVYAVIFGLTALAGCAAGSLLRKKTK